MIANLISRDGCYRCSNCMTKTSQIISQCRFCGCIFSNWEELACKEIIRQMGDEIIDKFADIKDIKVGDKP